ncbi:MAG: hypothetical protein KDC66_22165 [Phaeodactylibacter sp.]|nr:hypothetical protein [Phaeodactylibacter sp.]MCB9276485.1 hypothetical protein [Lewinellaceae bacterium]
MPTTSTQLVLNWLKRSITVHGGFGSAAFYQPLKGWSAPYPETTGYIIETLWDYYHLSGDEMLKRQAITCTDWLCNIQREDGSWNGGVNGSLPPIVFDTGMILFGLARSFSEAGDERYLGALRLAAAWLLRLLDDDGCWRKASFRQGFSPSYYSRAIWAIAQAKDWLDDEKAVAGQLRQALAFYAKRIRADHTVTGWGFEPTGPAFTHTIAYTLRGFLEASALLTEGNLLEPMEGAARQLMRSFEKKGRLAGSYDENWQGDFSYTCLTGNAQLSAFFARLSMFTQNEIYLQFARRLFGTIAHLPCRLPHPGLRGAVAGPRPLWGKYHPWQFPNWAAKFYLDAAKETGSL